MPPWAPAPTATTRNSRPLAPGARWPPPAAASAAAALLALIGQIPDAALLDPAGRVNWWVRYTTYSHYGEHIWELSEWRKQAAAGDDGQ